jgi:hypothetical protein
LASGTKAAHCAGTPFQLTPVFPPIPCKNRICDTQKMRNFARRPSSEIHPSRRCSRASDFARPQQGHDHARRIKIQSRSKLSAAVFGFGRRGYPAASHPESADHLIFDLNRS